MSLTGMSGIPSRVKYAGKLLKLVNHASRGEIMVLEYEEYELWQVTSEDGDYSDGIPGKLTVSYRGQGKKEKRFKKKSEIQSRDRIMVEYEIDSTN